MIETVTLTRARFDELINIERSCGDFVAMLIDLNQPQSTVPAMAGIEASSRYVAGMIKASLAEAAMALSLPLKDPA